MAKILLTPQELLAQGTEMASLQKEYETVLQQMNATLKSVNGNWSDTLARNFLGKMNSAQKGCDQLVTSLETGAQLAKASAQTFQSMDEQLSKYFGGGSADLSVSQYVDKMQQTISSTTTTKKQSSSTTKKTTTKKTEKKSLWDKICDGAEDLYDSVSTGVAKAVDVVADGVESALDFVADGVEAAWDFTGEVVDQGIQLVAKGVDAVGNVVESAIDSYQEKGVVYKVVKTGAAVVSTVGACTSIVASWGAAIGSGGMAAGLAAVSTTYGLNTIATSFADIYNCWGGDVEMVGKENFLKESMEAIGGAIGGVLGSEEVGENIAGAVYAGGSLLSIINNISVLSDKVTQLDDYGMTLKEGASQLKKGLDGVVDIVTHSPVSNVKLDLALLSHQVPELMDAIGVVKVGSQIVGTGVNLGTTVGKVVNELIGNETSSPSLLKALGWDDAETVMNVVDTGNDVVKMVTEGFEKFGDAWNTLFA